MTQEHPPFYRVKRWLYIFTLCCMCVIAIGSLLRVFSKDFERKGSDFYGYWYYTHFIWEGQDPYQAFLEQDDLTFPIRYLDGTIINDSQAMPLGRGTAPGNTAPLLLVLSPLALLSWKNVSLIWILINTTLCVVIGTMIVQRVGHPLKSLETLFVIAIFFSLLATRATFDWGQMSLFIFFLCFVSIVYAEKYPIGAGIALGIALSKYSLSFPVVLLLLYNRQFIGVLVSILVQIGGAVVIAFMGKTSVITVIESYQTIALHNINTEGNQLSVTLLRSFQLGGTTLFVVGSIFLIIPLGIYLSSRGSHRGNHIMNMTIFMMFSFWNFLFVYHRIYDHVINILFIALIILVVNAKTFGHNLRTSYDLTQKQIFSLNAGTGLLLLFWIFPTHSLWGETMQSDVIALCNVIGFAMMTWLLFKIRIVDLDLERVSCKDTKI